MAKGKTLYIPFDPFTGDMLNYISENPNEDYYQEDPERLKSITMYPPYNQWPLDEETGRRVRPPQPTPLVFKVAKPFHTALVLKLVDRGRSAHHAIFQDAYSGIKYTMHAHEFNRLLEQPARWQEGLRIYGEWTFVKKGANYFIEEIPLEGAHE